MKTGNYLYSYRIKNKINQKKMAQILGINQATVSRIESGLIDASTEVRAKIERLAKAPIEKVDGDEKKYNIKSHQVSQELLKGELNYSTYWTTINERSGDYWAIDKLYKNEKIFLFISDTVGHGEEASTMASCLGFGYKQLISLFSPVLSPYMIEESLRTSINATKDIWIGPPSTLIGMLNFRDYSLELLSAGMPMTYIFSDGKVDPIKHKEERSALYTGKDKIPYSSETVTQYLNPGDSILFYTDGFSEAFSKVERKNLKNKFKEAASLLKGDSKAILNNLTNNLKLDKVEDDVTILVFSRQRT